MDSQAQMEELTGIANRAAGSDAERRAATLLRSVAIAAGQPAKLSPTRIHPRFGLLHTGHALLAIVGSVLAAKDPPLGAALVAIALVSTVADVTGLLGRPTRRLTPRRASQNVEVGERPEAAERKPGLLLIVACYDAPRAAPAFALASRLLRDPWRALAGAIALVLACCVVRVATGSEATVLTAIQFIPTILLILLVPALADLELSGVTDGAGEAAAALTALALGKELDGRLAHFDVQVLLTGATAPFALGLRAWLRTNRRSLERERTAVISVDAVGSGSVRFARRQGPLFARAAHPDLLRICTEIAEDEGAQSTDGAAAPFVSRTPGNAAAARARGLPAITLTTAGGPPTPEGSETVRRFCLELAQRLDQEVGPRLKPRPAPDAVAVAPNG